MRPLEVVPRVTMTIADVAISFLQAVRANAGREIWLKIVTIGKPGHPTHAQGVWFAINDWQAVVGASGAHAIARFIRDDEDWDEVLPYDRAALAEHFTTFATRAGQGTLH